MNRIFAGSVKTVWLLLFLLSIHFSPALATVDLKDVMAVSAAIESIHLEGQENYFLPPGSEGQLVAKTFPENLKNKVRWEIVNKSADLDFEFNPTTGLLVVTPRSGLGWFTVRASAEGCLPCDQRIDVDCECREEYGPCGGDLAGGEFNIGSVDVRLGLGKDAEGRSAGDLFLYAEDPLVNLATPEVLVINSSSDQVIPFYRNGLLEQIVTPQAIVNFIRYSPQKYEIHFYDVAFRGRQLDDGAYNLDPRAVPLAVWCIENPDETGKTINHLLITETRDGKDREFLYGYEALDKRWSLTSGNGLRTETRAETTNAAGDRVVRSEVAGPDGRPVRAEETVYRDFAFGEKRIRETVDPEGAALTTEYRYRTDPGPGYGKLAARIEPDGGWVRYDYDEAGRIIREVRPFLDAPLASPDEKAVVVAKSYLPVDPADRDAENDRHRPRLVIKTVNGIETARTYPG